MKAHASKKYQLGLLWIVGVAPLYLNDLYNPHIRHNLPVFWTVELLTWIALPAFVFHWIFNKKLFTFDELGLHTHLFGKPATVCSFLGAIVMILCLMVGFHWVDRAFQQIFPPAKSGFYYMGVSAHDQAALSSVQDNVQPPVPPAVPQLPSGSTPALPPSMPVMPVMPPPIPSSPPPASSDEYSRPSSAKNFYHDSEEGSESFSVSAPTSTAHTSSKGEDTDSAFIDPLIVRWLKVFFFALSAGIVEELYFRGWLRRLFSQGYLGAGLFVLISSALFALIHWGNGTVDYGFNFKHLAVTFCWGLGSALAYLKINNLWFLIVAHALLDVSVFASQG